MNKGKSRKRVVPKNGTSKPTDAESPPTVDANEKVEDQLIDSLKSKPVLDELKKGEPVETVTTNPEKSQKKRRKPVGKGQIMEKKVISESKNENFETQKEVGSELSQSPKQVKRIKMNKKNANEKADAAESLENSGDGSASIPTKGSDACVEDGEKENAQSNNLNKRGKKNKGQRVDNGSSSDVEIVKEKTSNLKSKLNEETEVSSNEVKESKRGRPRKNKATKNDTVNEDKEVVATKTKPRKNKGEKPEHKTADASNDDMNMETSVSPKTTKKTRKQKKNTKSDKESEENKEAQTDLTKPEGSKPDISPDEDFEIEQPLTKKANKPKPTKKPSPASSSKDQAAPKPPNRSILQLKISLQGITPQIYRRIQVLNNATFFDLRNHINEAMGWISDRSHQFIVHNPKTNSNVLIVNGALEGITYDFSERHLLKEQSTKLSRFLTAKGDRLLYEFDLGDSWMHEVCVEKILPPPPPKAEYPKCTGGKRACPPEDCGGVDGYNHLVEVYKDPNHKEYQELITEWLGEYNPGWDPEKFEKNKVFKRVRMWVWAPS